MVMFYALVALCFSSGALAQMAGWGSCPEVKTMKDFNIRDIQGRWYEVGRYLSLGGMEIKCVTSDILHHGGHGLMQINTTAVVRETGKVLSVNGIKMRVADAKEPGKLEFQMPKSDIWENYWILGGEADSWMVAYSCIDLELIHLKYIWISARQPHPTGTVVKKAVKALEQQNLSGDFMYTMQEYCDVIEGSDESDEDEDYKDVHILH